jgi:hypothetical protein
MKQFKTNAGRFGFLTKFLMVFLFSLIFSSFSIANEAEMKARKAEIYRVHDIKVDEKAGSAEKAQNKALITGRRAALAILFKKILAKDDRGKVPYLSNNQIEELSTGFAVSHEKRSNVRYMANLSFYFDQDKIHDIFALLGIPSAELYATPLQILPILKENGEYYIWSEANIWRSIWQDYDYVNELIKLNILDSNMEYEAALSPALMRVRDIKKAPDFSWEKAIEEQKYDAHSYEIFAKKYFSFNSSDSFYVAQVNLQRLGNLEDMKLGLTIYKVQKDNGKKTVKPVFYRFYAIEIDQNGKTVVVSEKPHIKIFNDRFLKFNDKYYNEEIILSDPLMSENLTAEDIEAREAADLLTFEENLKKEGQEQTPDVSLLNPSSSGEGLPSENEYFVEAVDQLFEKAQKDIIEYFAESWKEKTLVDFTKTKEINVVIHLENSKTWFSVNKKLNELTLMNSVKLINLNIKKANISFRYAGNLEQLKFDMEKHHLKFQRLLTEEQIVDYHDQLKSAEEKMASALFDKNIIYPEIKKPAGLGAWSISLIK